MSAKKSKATKDSDSPLSSHGELNEESTAIDEGGYHGMSADMDLLAAMRANNLEALPSDDFKTHPLWPSIFEWVLNSPSPRVAWDLPADFFAAVEALPVDEFEKKQHRRAFQESKLLLYAMMGDTSDPGDHAMLYHAAEHRLGDGLCYATGVAWRLERHRSDGLKDFSKSLRQEGMVMALEAWLQRPSILSSEYNAIKEIPWACKLSESGSDEGAANYFLAAFQKEIGDSKTYRKAIVNADGNARRDAANLKKRREGEGGKKKQKEQNEAEFRDLIEHLWIPWALWRMSNDEILTVLQPARKVDICNAHERIARDISDLHFSSSRIKK
jgi:hypothetical protein